MVNSRIRTPFDIFFLNPVYVAARSAAMRCKISWYMRGFNEMRMCICFELYSVFTGLPYMAIQSKNALDFSVFLFLCRKTEKLRNRIFPIAPLVSIVSRP